MDTQKKPALRLIQGGPDSVEAPPPQAAPTPPKSAMARQLTSFADDLDRQIQAILNS